MGVEGGIQPGLVNTPELLHTKYRGHAFLLNLRNEKTNFWLKDKVTLSMVLFWEFKDQDALQRTRGHLLGPYPVATVPCAALNLVLGHGSMSLPLPVTLPAPPRFPGDLLMERAGCETLPCDLRAAPVLHWDPRNQKRWAVPLLLVCCREEGNNSSLEDWMLKTNQFCTITSVTLHSRNRNGWGKERWFWGKPKGR